MRHEPLVLEQPQHAAHSGIGWGIRERFPDLSRRGLAQPMEHIHDLAFASSEVTKGIRHTCFDRRKCQLVGNMSLY
jgi:hypothetical protein